MPLFVCDSCRHIENTATSNFWSTVATGKPHLCSQCDPEIGKWHGIFPRTPWDGLPAFAGRPLYYIPPGDAASTLPM